MNEKEQLEQQMTETLTEGKMEAQEPDEAARERLRPRYEIRIQASTDPIVAETRKFRTMAKEIDGRYDRYVRQAEQQDCP
ncbi:hypothetical protein SD70_14435 [Gordoniibacillus kamchatkensis]|uniref:Uncharacterized protein n=1 Tax=Gordoniibacillus kamchatkensis TaxID=1590651 RepID=A0ABR5AGV4_9BACL|nr:hypothetical protein [Paenibacillus sp. VKM B-2647]KIL40290.1 hypothetical protein SD70_14435 [Paenibacillus sp. VKM B-2647]